MAYIGTPVQQALTKVTSQSFNGTGSQTVFTLNRAVNTGEELEVFVNNVQQEPGVGKSYTATGTTLTFDAAPASGTGNIYVIYRGLAEVTRRLEHDPGTPLAATTGTFSDGITVDKNGATVATFDRATSDGSIVDFQKSGTTVGSIGAWSSGLLVGTGDVGLAFVDGTPERIQPRKADDQLSADGLIDLGHTSNRFKNLYLSGGVVFGTGGPSPITSNTLDDYEEGTWTPTLNYGTVSSLSTWYTKVGNLVSVGGLIYDFTDRSTGDQVIINNLPFTTGSSVTAGSVFFRHCNISGNQLSCYTASTATNIQFWSSSFAGGYTTLTHSQLNSSDARIFFGITYATA